MADSPRPTKAALSELKHFGRQFKGLLAFIDELEEIDSFDALTAERKATIADLEGKIATLESDAVKRATELDEEIGEANARKSSIEAKTIASKAALSEIGNRIAEAEKALATAIATKEDELARATAEAEQRLAFLNRDIAQAEERLAATQSQIKKLREHLAV